MLFCVATVKWTEPKKHTVVRKYVNQFVITGTEFLINLLLIYLFALFSNKM